MDLISYILSRKYCDNSISGISGVLAGKNCTIYSSTKSGDTTTIVFKWTADDGTTRTTEVQVKDGETPAFSSVAITGGHRLTFTTQDPAQSVAFNVMDGAKGDMGISVVASNVDDNNNLTLTLSNGNVINAGKIKAVTTVDNALSTTSSNPVENKVITDALNNKVDKEMGKGLFSDEEKAKLANIEDGAQVNVLEKLIINGQEATITDKSIALTLITSAVSNLQNYYLKTETYTKQEVEDLIGSTVGVTIEIVEQLPTEGQSNVIYFLPTETEGVYSQYIYSNNSWILIGSTTVDLSNYYTKAQVDTLLNSKQNVLTIDAFPTALSNNPVASGGVYTAIAQMQPQFQFANMPTASSTNLGFVYQYTGATGTYTQNMFYRCIYDDVLGEYKWEEVIFHATVTVDSAISGTSTNPVQNKVIKEALDTKQDIMQYSTMPSAQDNLGKIVQYIGTNTANYTNGYFYKAVYDSESDVYLWSVIKFSADMLVDNALSTTSENPVQNKVITAKINSIDAVIPSEASDTNQLVDRDSLGTASQKNFTPYVSPDNADVPISSSVYSAITSAVYGAYHPSGSKTIAELTSDLLVLANIGNVYKITEDGVTTNLFVGGAGQTIHTGDNAVVVYGGQPNTFLFDLQSGSIDLTPYQTKALGSAVEGETTVEGALGALSTNKASKVSGATNGNLAGLDSNGNLTDSGKKASDFGTADEIADIVNVYGAKNLMETTASSHTQNGITKTVNADGSFTLNGTATDNTYFYWTRQTEFPTENIQYTYSIETSAVWGIGKAIAGIDKRSETAYIDRYKSIYADGTTHIEGTFTGESGYYAWAWIFIPNGTQLTDVIVKGMIRLASVKDNTYVPYAKSNQQLTQDSVTWDDLSEVGAVNYFNNTASSPQTDKGVTYTVDATTKKITATGTNDGTANSYIVVKQNLKAGTYRCSGCPSGGSNGNYRIVWDVNDRQNNFDYGDGVIITLATDGYVTAYFNIMKNYAISGSVVFEPMITSLDYNGPYVPYAKTNRELTDESELITLPATKNDSIIGSSFMVKVRKQYNAVYITGYFNTSVAANRNDLLFTISGLSFLNTDDHFYATIMNSHGVTLFAEIYPDGTVKLSNEEGMASGYYIVQAVLLAK